MKQCLLINRLQAIQVIDLKTWQLYSSEYQCHIKKSNIYRRINPHKKLGLQFFYKLPLYYTLALEISDMR